MGGAGAERRVLVPRRPELSDAELQAAVERVNAGLPDYARVHHWLRAAEPSPPVTACQRRRLPQRPFNHYQSAINALPS